MNPLRIVFMGTPDIAVPTLQALIDSPHTVVGVFCQPDKPKGRGNKLQMPPTKELALEYDIPVYQPKSLRNEEAEELLQSLAPDIVVVIAYGKILPSWLIHQPPLGCINLHASLLPKFRGAAPIQYAILHEESETGMTIMHMDEGLDSCYRRGYIWYNLYSFGKIRGTDDCTSCRCFTIRYVNKSPSKS